MKHPRRPHLRRSLALAAALLTLAAGAPEPSAQGLGDANGQAQMRAHRPSVPGANGLVTSANPLASMSGMRILLAGGNAFDAAVAVATTLNVVEPTSSGIGGNGFATVFDKATGKVWSLSMAGAAPKAIEPEKMTADMLDSGIKAGIVPGNLGGYLALLERFGTMSLADVLTPAIEYANNGHPINDSFATAVNGRKDVFAGFPSSAAVFMPGGHVPVSGEIVRLPALGATLGKLVDAERTALSQGATREAAIQAAFARFYTGDIADAFDRFFTEQGGYLRKSDLEAYAPKWETPLHTTYRGYDIYSNTSTSRGGFEVLMQLNFVEGFDLKAMGAGSPEALHVMAEAIKLAKADIYRYVADPAFTTIPVEGMLSKDYAVRRHTLIDRSRAMAYPGAGDPTVFDGMPGALAQAGRPARGPQFPERYEEDPETSSFSIADRAGNAVAVTPTLGGFFGTNVVVGDTGVLLNNGMRLGSTSPYPDNVNYVRPGQIPILNNSPVIIMKDGRFVMAIGTPGGETIGQTQFQAIINVIDFGLTIQEAIEAPRFRLDPDPNFYKPGAAMTFSVENRVPTATLDRLRAMGHTVNLLPDFTAGVGGMQGILVDLATGTMTAGADPRRAGYAVGW